MFGGTRLKVINSHEKNTFGYINTKYSSSQDQTQCVQFHWHEKKYYLWTICSNAIAEHNIAINPTFRKLLEIPEGSDLFISPCNSLNVIQQISVTPDSPDDQEILEHNAEVLQLRLLDQVRVVVKDQKTLVWIYSSMPIVFTPSETGILVNHSEVVVKLDNFIFKPPNRVTDNSPSKGDTNININNIGMIINDMLNLHISSFKVVNEKIIARVLLIENKNRIDDKDQTNCIHPYLVFLHKDLLPKNFAGNSTILAEVEVATPKLENKSKEEIEENIDNVVAFTKIVVEVKIIDELLYKSLSWEYYNKNIPTILVTKYLSKCLNINNGIRIELSFLPNLPEKIEKIEIEYFSKSNIRENIINNFKDLILKSNCKYLVNNGVVIEDSEIISCPFVYNLKNTKCTYAVVDVETLREISITTKANETDSMVLKGISPEDVAYESKEYCREIDHFESNIRKCKCLLEFEKHREATFKNVSDSKGNILITGPPGSGKSSLVEMLSKELLVYSTIVPCRPLKGRKDIVDVLQRVVRECSIRSPSVLFCDDIDALVVANTEGIASQDVAYYERLAHSIKQLLRQPNGVTTVMTVTNTKNLHPILRKVDAEPLYTDQLTIGTLNQKERMAIYKYLLHESVKKEFNFDDEDVEQLATESSGYSIREIIDNVNKLIYKAVKRKINGAHKPRLVEKVDKANEQDPFDVFANVGGMDGVKQEITEKVFWPVIYPSLFPSQSCGILLFGPPGMGKTYIGSCLARLSNMSFISVKGPELLSKYIGQSEKAVRDIFDDADARKPCILFFDEFDSIAPKRGHDSTGVTDRVVNQFLARLDGAEGGAKGPVIAATSRPDLIDPALLRPGRLDQHIYCAPPDRLDRLDILSKISKTMELGDGASLEGIADRTEGFSPADLKSILVTAQLSAVDRCVNNGADIDKVIVTPEDLENALLESKPSLSTDQLMFYNIIYKRFRGEKPSQEEVQFLGPQIQRVTLA